MFKRLKRLKRLFKRHNLKMTTLTIIVEYDPEETKHFDDHVTLFNTIPGKIIKYTRFKEPNE